MYQYICYSSTIDWLLYCWIVSFNRTKWFN